MRATNERQYSMWWCLSVERTNFSTSPESGTKCNVLIPPPPLSRYCPSLLINSSLYQQHLPVLFFLVFLSFLLSLNNHVVTRERNFKLSSVAPPPTLIDRQEKQSSTYRIMSNPLMGLSKTKESNEKKQSKTKPPKLHCGSRRLLYYSVQV